VAVSDNQQVKQGELLFAIDPSDYELAVKQAQVSLDQAREDVEALEAAVRAAEAVVEQSNAAVNSAQGEIDAATAAIRSADAAIKEAESGVISAQAFIVQMQATVEEAQRESERAKRLADRKAGSVETAEAKAAAVKAYQAQLESAKAGLQQAQATLDKAMAAKGEAAAKLAISENGLAEAQAAVVTAIADRDQAKANLGQPGEANVRIRSAQVSLDQAQLKLDWTEVYAPADGYISNLNLKEGAYASAGAALIALVDRNSLRVHAYFEETKLRHIAPGDAAIVTLMSHPDQRLSGEVESIGQATNPPKVASTEGELGVVPSIEPTFDWVRLAQRVPVTIRLQKVPEGVRLISGTTASISIEK
jgi:multidrug resistance efflux pump